MNTEEVIEIAKLRKDGYPYQEIADRLGISKKTAWKYGRNVKMRDDKRYQRQRNEGVGALRRKEDDGRKIGTWRDIPSYNSLEKDSKERRAEEKKAEENKGERSKRWRENEKIHEEGRKEQIEAGAEVVRFVESLMSRKTTGGHLAKAMHHGMKALGKKRELLERSGDVRLLGENMRKLAGDENSHFGMGIIRIGKEGILGNFRKKFLERRK